MSRLHAPTALAFALLAGAFVFAPLVGLTVIVDGAWVAAVLLGSLGWGAALTNRLDVGGGRTAWACTALAIGLGLVGLATLALGLLGLLNALTGWGLLVAGGLVGLLAAPTVAKRWPVVTPQPPPPPDPSLCRSVAPSLRRFSAPLALDALTALLLAGPIAILLLGASLPPGVLWLSEGQGYDVREYHLQAPREYFEAGAIHFLPHNVYASFPQQVEVLYLLLMHLTGDPAAAAVPSQLLHAALALLAGLATAAWLPRGPARAAALLLTASLPWLGLVGALAYVEAGMLMFAAVAAGLLRPLFADAGSPGANVVGRVAAAGACAGWSGGCKYTSLVLVAFALVLALLLASHGSWRRRAGLGAIFALAAGLTFSPWAARNLAFTGNPIYPFGYAVFGGAAWSPEQDAQWRAGHRPPSDRDGLTNRLQIAIEELLIVRDPQGGWRPTLFGGVIPLGLTAVLLQAGPRRRAALADAVWVGVIFAAWMLLTHMPGRFAMPVIVPLSYGLGRVVASGGWLGAAGVAAAGMAALLHTLQLGQLLRENGDFWQKTAGVELVELAGDTAKLQSAHLLHQLPESAYVWLVGDAAPFYLQRRHHYTVVFSRDPWLTPEVQATPQRAIAWLRERGVTHVAIAWSEVERLRATYGFSEVVTPAWAAGLKQAGLRPAAGEFAPVYEVLAVPGLE